MAKRKATAKQLANLKKGRLKRMRNLRAAKTSVRKVSKRRITKSKSKVTKVAKRRRTRKANKSKGMFAGVSGMLGAVAYGAVREQISSAIATSAIGRQLPVTQFTDEAVMLGLNFGARKLGLGKNPIGNSILRAQKTVELARIGQGIRDVMAAKSMATNNGIQLEVIL